MTKGTEMDLMPSYSFVICQGEDGGAQHLRDMFFSAFGAPGVNFPSTFCSPQGLSDTFLQSRLL